MTSNRSTDTVRKALLKEVDGVAVGVKMSLDEPDAFRLGVMGWMSKNTRISPKTLAEVEYDKLLQEWREKSRWVHPKTIEEAVEEEMQVELRGHERTVQDELDDLPYSNPIDGPKGRPHLDKKAWHGIAGEILEYVSPDTEADPAGILATLMSSFSCMVGHDRIVHGPVKQRVNVWTILIGDTGEGRKGTATDRALEILHKVNSSFFKNNTTTSLSSGEGLIYSVRDGMDEDEIARREDNGQKVDYGVDDKRLLVMSTEFATIMQKTHGSTLGPVMRDAWDGKTLNIHSMDAEVATDPHITIMGHVTGQEFADRQKATEMAGGTWNRFSPIFVHRPHEIPWPEDPDDWEQRLEDFAMRLRDAVNRAGREDGPVVWSKEAQLLYRREIYREYANTSGDSEVMKQFTTRRLPSLVRAAGVYALMDGRDVVSLEDLEAAKAFVDYSIASARFVLGEFMSGSSARAVLSAEEREAQDKEILAEALMKAGVEGLTRTHINQKTLKYRRKKPEIDSFIEDLGLVVVKRVSGGRPTEIVVHPDFAPKGSDLK
ncbi:DUF3987 domain-containing protein [Streptomyces noursei]|uniref:DUF3987 domain-containing protein n=1 Tax=Streptomyces noursei TaxID=1971 RepID=UPI0033F66347